ncbi:MAG TPA: replicative DNA helicase [Campylobacterales bacterium]|nr:replicative DNA helicase [Campylobacterales bacterium]
MGENQLHNLNIERAVLSSILFDPSLYEDVASKIKPRDFYLPDHRSIFEAMEVLEREDKPIDEEFLRKKLLQNDKFNEDVFIEIISSNPLSNSAAYIDEIKEKAVKRELIKLTSDIKDVAIDQDLPSDDVLDIIQKKLYEISLDATTKEFRDSPEMVTSTIAHIHEMKKRGNNGVIGVDTGFRELNELTAGFTEGQLIIVAARPAMGKTALTLNIAQKALDDGRGVAIFSLEMPAEELMLRMLSAKTSIPLQSLKVGDMSDEEWSNLTRATDEIARQKLFVDDDGMVNINQMRSKLRKLKMQHPEISIMIVDYLQLMSGAGGKDRHLEVSEISRGLKLLARELQMPIIALSQLNRGVESRHDKRPMLSDIRESGSIEQDADIILFVYRDDVYRMREEQEKEKKAKAEGQEYRSNYIDKPEEDTELIIGKNRSGPIGVANIVFQKRFTRFVDKGSIPVEIVYENADDNAKNSNFEMPAL